MNITLCSHLQLYFYWCAVSAFGAMCVLSERPKIWILGGSEPPFVLHVRLRTLIHPRSRRKYLVCFACWQAWVKIRAQYIYLVKFSENVVAFGFHHLVAGATLRMPQANFLWPAQQVKGLDEKVFKT